MLNNCITMCQGSWAGVTALCMEAEWRCTIAVLAWCSVYQFPGCEYTVKRSQTPLGHLFAEYMSIYSHIQS